MFTQLELKKSGLQRYVRFNRLLIDNPLNGEPSVTVSEERVLIDDGVTSRIPDREHVLRGMNSVPVVGLNGKPTGEVYTAEQVAIVLNSLCHAARNQPEPGMASARVREEGQP